MPEPTRISLDGVNYVFGADGFPESITLDGFNGTVIPAAGRNFSRIKIRMSREINGETVLRYDF